MRREEYQKKIGVLTAFLPIGIILAAVLPAVVSTPSVKYTIMGIGIVYLLVIIFVMGILIGKYNNNNKDV